MINKSDEKCIRTMKLNIMGNMMTWQGMLVQLSNVSYITTDELEAIAFPWISIMIIFVGFIFAMISFLFTIVAIALGVGLIYLWYKQEQKRKSSARLTLCMNSGDKLALVFLDRSFLTKVMHVLEKIILEGGIGNNEITIDLSGAQFHGDASVLNDLGIK